MTRIFYKIILCARQALEFSHGQDPQRKSSVHRSTRFGPLIYDAFVHMMFLY